MTTPPDALHQLQVALDGLARALASGQADAVLAAEEPIAAAVSRLAYLTQQTRSAGRGTDLRESVRATRLAIERCRALGRAAAEFAGPPLAYGPRGRRVPAVWRSSNTSEQG